MQARGVTVAIVLHNGIDHLPHCAEAVRALTDPVDEVLVIDNASTDGGAAWVEAHWPDARLVREATNRGPCVARNRAITEARCDRIYLLDCDVVPAPDSVGLLAADLDAHPDCVVAQPRAVFAHEPTRIHYDGGWFGYTGLLTLHNFGRLVADAPSDAIDIDAVISMALLFDRARYRALGDLGPPFDPLYFIYFEDTDLSYRVRLAGGGLRLVPRAVVGHRDGTPGVSYRPGRAVSHRRATLLSRNRWLLMLKTYRWRTLVVTLPAQIAYEFVQCAFLTVRGQPHGWLAGKVGVLTAMPAALRARSRVQATRRVGDRDLLRFRGFSFIPLLDAGSVGRTALAVLNGAFGAWWRMVRWLT